MATKTFCDFCEEEIPDEIPSKQVHIAVEPAAQPTTRLSLAPLEKDACFTCGDRIRRILSLADGKQIEKILESVTRR